MGEQNISFKQSRIKLIKEIQRVFVLGAGIGRGSHYAGLGTLRRNLHGAEMDLCIVQTHLAETDYLGTCISC